jgi:hypothetical protein
MLQVLNASPKAAQGRLYNEGTNMRAEMLGLLLSAVFCAGSASAFGAQDPNNCNGVEWDDNRALVVAKVTAHPRVNLIKSSYDDDFRAGTCPAATKGCRKESYLVTGDLVLVGKTQGDFTCVDYQSPLASKQRWIMGWLPSTTLTPVAPMASPKTSDWIGSWYHPGGAIEIKPGDGSKLRVEGGMTLPTPSGDFQNGDFKAEVAPQSPLAFTDEGNYGEGCHVRMQRIGPSLLVEDNGGCGGAGVTFTGLYRRKN